MSHEKCTESHSDRVHRSGGVGGNHTLRVVHLAGHAFQPLPRPMGLESTAVPTGTGCVVRGIPHPHRVHHPRRSHWQPVRASLQENHRCHQELVEETTPQERTDTEMTSGLAAAFPVRAPFSSESRVPAQGVFLFPSKKSSYELFFAYRSSAVRQLTTPHHALAYSSR